MRKIILTMNMTLDGFFNLDWMGQRPFTPDQELNDDTLASMRDSGGALVGYPFYLAMVPYWSDVEHNPASSESERAIAHAVNTSRRFVLSRTQAPLDGPNAELLLVKSDQEVHDAVTRLKRQKGRALGVIGGVRTAQTLVRLGLIDEYD